jgi:hypothetical protein
MSLSATKPRPFQLFSISLKARAIELVDKTSPSEDMALTQESSMQRSMAKSARFSHSQRLSSNALFSQKNLLLTFPRNTSASMVLPNTLLTILKESISLLSQQWKEQNNLLLSSNQNGILEIT